MAQGKGISESVRNTVLEWLDNDTVNSITKEARKKDSSFDRTDMTWDSKAWVRNNRRKSSTGFTRSYRCKLVSGSTSPDLNLELEVRSNKDDTRINYYAFKVNGKFVAGGQADVASVNISSNRPNVAKVGAVSKAEYKDSASGITTKIGSFKRLSPSEVDKLNAQTEFGTDGAFDQLFESRE